MPSGPGEVSSGMLENRWESSLGMYRRSGRHGKVGEDGRHFGKGGVVLLIGEMKELSFGFGQRNRRQLAVVE